ncbi:hypothetical protein PM082_016684 [Marasmius tenuissimus]|nr:hypothetical protein PM082_016684 [Marasmius tenuissimus]
MLCSTHVGLSHQQDGILAFLDVFHCNQYVGLSCTNNKVLDLWLGIKGLRLRSHSPSMDGTSA